MANIYPHSFQKLHNDIKIGGCSLKDLAEEFGTPLYVLDEGTIRDNCQLFTKTLTEHYPNFTIAYASKANLNIGIANVIADEGCGADVVSGGELFTVLKSDINPDKVYFHGNNKSATELELAISNDIRIVVDNKYELSLIESISHQLGKKALIMLRIKPGIEAHTHEYIKTGQIDSKFGLDLDEAMPLIKAISDSSWGDFIGIHAHIGSQIFDIQPYQDLVAILVDYIAKIKATYNILVNELNFGGGFGIKYTDSDNAPDIKAIILSMINELKLLCETKQLQYPKVIFEPGRSIIANAGVTLYSVGATKDIPGVKNYIFVDGGMADNPRPIMYQAKYSFDIVSPSSPDRKSYTIAGKFCESGDILAHDVSLPIAKANDFVVVYGTGAYNYSMASNYNRYCKPAMVLISSGKAKCIIRRETFEDIIRYDQL